MKAKHCAGCNVERNLTKDKSTNCSTMVTRMKLERGHVVVLSDVIQASVEEHASPHSKQRVAREPA